MRFEKPEAEIWRQGPNKEDMYYQVERVGRICYASHSKSDGTLEKAKEFTERMLKSGHGEMLEHATVYLKMSSITIDNVMKYLRNPYSIVKWTAELAADKENTWYTYYITTNLRVIYTGEYDTFIEAYKNGFDKSWEKDLRLFQCDRTEHHEERVTVYMVTDRCTGESFIRHRVFSKARESTRACNYTREKFSGISCIWPCWDMTLEQEHTLTCALEMAEKYYNKLIELGWSAEQARIVLPFDIKSPLAMTGSVSQWKEFLEVRADSIVGRAHPQSIEIASIIREKLKEEGLEL